MENKKVFCKDCEHIISFEIPEGIITYALHSHKFRPICEKESIYKQSCLSGETYRSESVKCEVKNKNCDCKDFIRKESEKVFCEKCVYVSHEYVLSPTCKKKRFRRIGFINDTDYCSCRNENFDCEHFIAKKQSFLRRILKWELKK